MHQAPVVLRVEGQLGGRHLVGVEPVADAAEGEQNGVRRDEPRLLGLRGLPVDSAPVAHGQRRAGAPLADHQVGGGGVVDEIIEGQVGGWHHCHAGQGVTPAAGPRAPCPLAVQRLGGALHAAVDLHGEEGQRRVSQRLARMAHEGAEARKVVSRAVFVPLGLALHPQDRPGRQPVQHVQHVAQESAPFSSGFHPAQRRAAVGAGRQTDGIAQLAPQALGECSRGLWRGCGSHSGPVHRARGLAQRVRPRSHARWAGARSRPVQDRPPWGPGPVSGVALPAMTNTSPTPMVHHVPARAGQPVPALVGHGGLKPVQAAPARWRGR